MAIDFPASPTNGQVFNSGALSWMYDGAKWTATSAAATPYNEGEVLGNPVASPTPPVATDLARMLRAALGDGTAGQAILSGGSSVDPAWGTVSPGSTLPSGTTHDQLVYVSGTWTAQRPRYIVAGFAPGVPTASQVLLVHVCSKGVTFPANFGNYLGHTSQARGTVAATASTTITVQKALAASPNSFTNVGTIVFSASGLVASSFTTTSGLTLTYAPGDTLQLVAPATADSTFAGLAASLVSYET